MADLSCAKHRAYAYSRGGARRLFELTPLEMVRWNRIRDDISAAEAVIPTNECCAQLDDLRTILNEIHIYRDGEPVWQGPITRLEYEYDNVRIFAEDVLFQAKRSAVNPGYDHQYPHMGYVLDTVDQLLLQCYGRQGDPWNMLPGHLHPIRTPDEPRHARVLYDWQDTAWNELDKFGEDYGIDYTVINRDIYYWDLHWEWKRLPALDEEWISDRVRVVEYGNSCYTRAIVTNGRGYVGIDQAGADVTDRRQYGFLDTIINNSNDTDTTSIPNAEELEEWQRSALRALNNTYPAPLGVVVPANTTLLPGAPWNISDLIPGAWFKVNVQRLCRSYSEWNRLQEVTVEETAPGGEQVNFTSITAPRQHHRLPL